jgi:hypothetical protein
MSSTMKKLLYTWWVLFLFGIAAILTVLELIFRKARHTFIVNND